MFKKLAFCIVACVILLVFAFIAIPSPDRVFRVIIASQNITVRLQLAPGWSEYTDGPQHESQAGGLWSPAFVDSRGRYITIYIGDHGDLYWQYLFGFRTYDHSEEVVVNGRIANLWVSKDGSFVLTMIVDPDTAVDDAKNNHFVAIAGNGKFAPEFVRDFVARLNVETTD